MNARSNIYTVLSLISVLALLSALVFVSMKNMELTETSNPFTVIEK